MNPMRNMFVILFLVHLFISVKSYHKCEEVNIAKCETVYRSAFTNSGAELSSVDTYCKAYVEIQDCLSSNKAEKCVGDVIDLLRFMIHQHMLVDKKLNVCPHTDLHKLEALVHAPEHQIKIVDLKDVDSDVFDACVAQINNGCAARLADEMRTGSRICEAIDHFKSCYKNTEIPCDSEIYNDFLTDMNIGNTKLFQLKKEMPKFRKSCSLQNQ